MKYVTSIERLAMEKGKKEGILQGAAALLQSQLAQRFGPLPEWVEERLAGASREELEGWADRVVGAEALEEVFG